MTVVANTKYFCSILVETNGIFGYGILFVTVSLIIRLMSCFCLLEFFLLLFQAVQGLRSIFYGTIFEPLDKMKKKKTLHFYVSYLKHQAFMAHIIWYSENMELTLEEEKTPQFYSEENNWGKNMHLVQLLIFVAKSKLKFCLKSISINWHLL